MGKRHLIHPDFLDGRRQVERPNMAIKRISIDALSIGMYVIRLDRAWPEYSSLASKHRVESHEDIAFLKQHGVLQVTIDPTLGKDTLETTPEEPPRELAPLAREFAAARAVRAEAMTALQGIFEGVRTGAPIDSPALKKTVYTLMDTILRRYDPILSLIHMQRNDISMFTHAINVCVFALVVGKNQGLNRSQLEYLGIGAMFHDVGELRLPRNLLRKPEPYTDQERRLIQQHPQLGVSIVSQSDDVHEESRRIVLEHHERIDGSGYPGGLRGMEISPLSEVVGIVDVYDMLLNGREGRPMLLPSEAIKELYHNGLTGHMDRGWVERVIRCLGIYPVGSFVELSTGERGIVEAANPADALRPSVRIICDTAQQPYPTPIVVDLAAPHTNHPERTILRALDPVKDNCSVGAYLEGSCEEEHR